MEGDDKEPEKYKNTELCWERHKTKCKPLKEICPKANSPPKDMQKNSKSSKACKGREGKVTRNPFFNYLREIRKTHCDWPITKIAKEGAKLWCGMKPEQRKKYYDQACSAPKMRRRMKKRRRGASKRRRSRRRRGRCSR